MDTCVVCSKETKSRCSNCNQVAYCSLEHQKDDWKSHKSNCHPFKIAYDELLGRHLIATRKIKPFEVILNESPLVEGPLQITTPVCLGCLNGIEINDYKNCEKCGWPMCGVECFDSPMHLAECEFTKNRGRPVSIQDFENPHPLYHSLGTLRCLLLKKTNKEKWDKFNELESLEVTRRGSAQWKADLETIGKFIPNFYKSNEFDEDLIMKTVGILQINGHVIPTTQPSHVAVYYKGSLFEHSCLPNLAKSFKKNGNIIYWAPREINKGEHLSICYTDAVWVTSDRQNHLMQTKLFKCKCRRCVDVTEMDTFYNAVKCTNENCQGNAVPKNVQDSNENWRCVECHKEIKKSYVDKVVEKASKDLQAMDKNIDNLKKFIKHYEQFLNGNHYHLSVAKLQLVQLIGENTKELSTISDELLAMKLQYAKELIELYEIIAKCEARLIGLLCFELHAAIAEHARRLTMVADISQKNLLHESLFYVEKACNYLQYESIIFMEGHIYKQAKINRDSLKFVLHE